MKHSLLALCLLVAGLFASTSALAQVPNPSPISLLAAASATGPAVQWAGGAGVFAAVGTFGGATITLQFLGPDGVTWVAAGAATTLTAAGAGVFYLPRLQVRGLVTGGAGVSVTASAYILPNVIQ